jgi:hypothetical protein
MTVCSIVIVDAGPLKTLAYSGRIDLLLTCGVPVQVSDMVVQEIKNGEQFLGNRIALEFIECNLGKGITLAETGVPSIADKLAELNVDPGDESIRRLIARLDESTDGNEYALLVSEDDRVMKTADLNGMTYFLTTRPFLMEMQNRGLVSDAESLMLAAEHAAISAGEGPGRGQLKRKREWNSPPRRNSLALPFPRQQNENPDSFEVESSRNQL